MISDLPPMAWNVFKTKPLLSRQCIIEFINRAVNNAIDPSPFTASLTDEWKLAPKVGLCHDYVVTKRWLLLNLGFMKDELTICECELNNGEHHLVLIIDNDCLDNLTQIIAPIKYKIINTWND